MKEINVICNYLRDIENKNWLDNKTLPIVLRTIAYLVEQKILKVE